MSCSRGGIFPLSEVATRMIFVDEFVVLVLYFSIGLSFVICLCILSFFHLSGHLIQLYIQLMCTEEATIL